MIMPNFPNFLTKGATIAIAAPARKVSQAELLPFISYLTVQGYHVYESPNLYAQDAQFAGTDAQRLHDLQTLCDAPDVDAIWFARGGYGTVRILDSLNWSGFLQNPKWLIGFSDLTVLLMEAARQGWVSVHSDMVINFQENTHNIEATLRMLTDQSIDFSSPYHYLNRCGTITAPIIGGNLTLLHHLIGTKTDFDSDGKILFIEDVGEYLYSIDRKMMHLKRAGRLANLAGLVVGGFTDTQDNTTPYGKTANEIVAEAVANYNYPVAFNMPTGHQKQNLPILVGSTVHFIVNAQQSVVAFAI